MGIEFNAYQVIGICITDSDKSKIVLSEGLLKYPRYWGVITELLSVFFFFFCKLSTRMQEMCGGEKTQINCKGFEKNKA